jgi:hypothetical protein
MLRGVGSHRTSVHDMVRFTNQLDFGTFIHDLNEQKYWGALLASKHVSFCAGDPDDTAKVVSQPI